MQPELVKTHDGSSTLLNPLWNVHYHSIFGAETESRHVFIQNGLSFLLDKKPSEIRIFEMGFGTGLNALLTLQSAVVHQKVNFFYFTLETNPIPNELIDTLRFDFGNELALFELMHQSEFETPVKLLPNFTFFKSKQEFTHCSNWYAAPYKLVYFDAFAPQVQPELWQASSFERIPLINEAVLVTYCAQGAARRAMKAAGFSIEKLQGPPGKREMTRATKKLFDTQTKSVL